MFFFLAYFTLYNRLQFQHLMALLRFMLPYMHQEGMKNILIVHIWHFLWTEGQAPGQNFSWFVREQEKAAGSAWPYGFEVGLGQTIWDEGQGLCGWTFPGAKRGRAWLSHYFNSLRTRKGRGGIWKLSSPKCQDILVNFSYSILFTLTERALWMGLLFVHGLEHHLLGVRKILLATHIFQISIYFII